MYVLVPRAESRAPNYKKMRCRKLRYLIVYKIYPNEQLGKGTPEVREGDQVRGGVRLG